MYEKHGLMSKIRNPLVLAYLRSNEESNTKLIENALWEKLGLSQKKEESKKYVRGRKKSPDCRNAVPVKVVDPALVDYLITQRKVLGISHRYTIENAILEKLSNIGGKSERNSCKCH